MRRFARAISALLGVPVAVGPLLVAAPGQAAGGATVEVEVEGCGAALAKDRLRDAIGVELRNLDEELVAYIEASRPRVAIRCAAEAPEEIDLLVTTERGEALRETLDASEAGTARFIAIAIAESLAAQASVPPDEKPPEPPVPPPPEPAKEPEVLAKPAPPKTDPFPIWWWKGSGGGRLFGDPGLASWEARLGAERVSSENWSQELDLAFTRGDVVLPRGELSAMTLSAGVALQRRVDLGRAVALPAFGVRAGALRWHGDPADRTTTRGLTGFGPWAGPFLELGLGLEVTPHIRVDVAAEGGFTPMQVKATDNSNVVGSIGELWLSLQLGLAVWP